MEEATAAGKVEVGAGDKEEEEKEKEKENIESSSSGSSSSSSTSTTSSSMVRESGDAHTEMLMNVHGDAHGKRGDGQVVVVGVSAKSGEVCICFFSLMFVFRVVVVLKYLFASLSRSKK